MSKAFDSNKALGDISVTGFSDGALNTLVELADGNATRTRDLAPLVAIIHRGRLARKLATLMPSEVRTHLASTYAHRYTHYVKLTSDKAPNKAERRNFLGMHIPEPSGRSYARWLDWGRSNLPRSAGSRFTTALFGAFDELLYLQSRGVVCSERLSFKIGAIGSTQFRFADGNAAKVRALLQEYSERTPKSVWFDVGRYGALLPGSSSQLPEVIAAGTRTSPTRMASIYAMAFSTVADLRLVFTTPTLKALLVDCMKSRSDHPVNFSWRKSLIDGYDWTPAHFSTDVEKEKTVTRTEMRSPSFRYGSAVMTKEMKAWIDAQINQHGPLWARPKSLYLIIRGSTDRSGSQRTNDTLSQQRADAVMSHLLRLPAAKSPVSRKFVRSEIKAFGLGERRAIRDREPDGKRNPAYRTVEIEFGLHKK